MANTSTAARTPAKASKKVASTAKAVRKGVSNKKVAGRKVAPKTDAAKADAAEAGAAKAGAKKAPAKKIIAAKPAMKKPAPKKAAAPSTVAGLVAVGAMAPDFTLMDGAGKPVSLSSLRGAPVVVYFYPKDDTSGCTVEACDFRDNLAAFRKLGCTVLGVSPDSVKSHAKFAAKHALGKLTLLADEPAAGGAPAACTAYGVWQQKSMYGRAYMGVVRTTYIVDAGGKVARRFDKVEIAGHATEVLAAVKALG